MATLFRHPIDSRVGRRIALAAVAAVLLPLAIFGSVVFARARTQLEAQAWERLHQDTKTAALNGLARLKLLEEELRWLARESPEGSRWSEQPRRVSLLGRVESLTLEPPSGAPRTWLRGQSTPPEIADTHLGHLRAGGAVLLAASEPRDYWLIADDPSGARAAGRFPVSMIFGFGEASPLPASDVLCLADAMGRVECSDADPVTEAAVESAALPPHGQSQVQVGNAIYFARAWSLPLQAEYRAGVWSAVMLTPQAAARATLWQLQRDVALLTLTTLIVVVLTVLAVVRRNLGPLSALTQAAAAVSRRQYDVPLHLVTGDEFETLADGFNDMVSAIRAQVEELQAFSIGTGTALARTIDAKSPWTSGHSERVTALSLRIAAALGLPDDQVLLLRRGGLLHDIGKLATPPEILDKPGRLTEEERAVIQRHPMDGVSILEPIGHFAQLLPIVREHHERFDGLGYPDGKSGQAIHFLARVLAVADVYDALTSDRPYRSGMSEAAALEIIREGSGTQFDPVVVDAFLGMPAGTDSVSAA